MIEYEIKLRADHGEMRGKLEEVGAKYLKSDHQIDLYYNHPSRDFAQTDEALRVRSSGQGIKLTYKGPKTDLRSKTREEIDLSVEGEGLNKMLEILGFELSGKVEKEREYFELDEVSIVLDDLGEIGTFVEVELVGEGDDNGDEIIDRLFRIVKSLGLDPNDQIRTSYLELVLRSDN